MQNIVGMLAQSFGIPPQMASTAMNGVTRMFLQRSSPKATSGVLNALPQDVTNQISDDDKHKLTTTQTNINRYDLLKQLSGSTGIKDIDKLDDLLRIVLLLLIFISHLVVSRGTNIMREMVLTKIAS